jgi:thiamine biosynthesis lipoprotein
MKKQASIMGMPVVIKIVDLHAKPEDFEAIFSYFRAIDEQFSTFKETSEITKINLGLLKEKNYSALMKKILQLCEQTKQETNGYFDIHLKGHLDPAGLVKGYAIHEGVKMLKKMGYHNFLVEIAGDIQTFGKNEKGEIWKVGIRNPFNRDENVKIVQLSNQGIATSGTYIRGTHIFDPHAKKPADNIASMTVVGPNVYEADRFATAAFAMGERGIQFIDLLPDFEGYMIRKDKHALLTGGFEKYVVS